MKQRIDHCYAGQARWSCDKGLMKTVANVAKILLEMVDYEADDGGFSPSAPVTELQTSLQQLVRDFREVVAMGIHEPQLRWIAAQIPLLRSEAELLRTDHKALEDTLADILELTGLGQRPTTSWIRIQSRFSSFTGNLVHHLARKRALFEVAFDSLATS